MIEPYSLEWHLQLRDPELPDTDRRLAHWLKQLDVTDTDGLFRAAKEILDNLPRLHEQSLDTLIRLATEKAHAAGMRIELIAHGPEETPEPADRLTAIEARLAALAKTVNEHDELWRVRNDEMLRVAERWEKINVMLESSPAPAQTRTYPVVEWAKDGNQYTAYVNGIGFGEAWEDGECRMNSDLVSSQQGSVKSAQAYIESRFRRWWDELHPQQS